MTAITMAAMKSTITAAMAAVCSNIEQFWFLKSWGYTDCNKV